MVKNKVVIVKNIHDFDINATLLSGQCFRFRKNDDKSFTGVVKNHILNLKYDEINNELIITGIDEKQYLEFYEEYFDLKRDYNKIRKELEQDEVMKKAVQFSPNIKILNQEFWETLCSFIISQNNNIPRITSIIETLCKNFGTKIKDDFYTFPSAKTISQLDLNQINIIKSGFRGKYILDAAKKVANKTVDYEKIKNMNLNESREHLMQIKGVGPKVADCTLLYGAKKFDAFPVDVWMKRAISTLYPNGIPNVVKKHAGIAQLYIFNYSRLSKEIFEQ